MHRSRPHRIFGWMVGLVVFLGVSGLARADEPRSSTTCPICSKAGNNNATYASKASCTLARGAANTLFGWTELIRQPAQEVKAGGNVFTGIATGLGKGVRRTFAGAGEVLTFWTPKTKNGYLHFADDCPLCMKGK